MEQVEHRVKILKPNVEGIRSFSCIEGNEFVPIAAKKHGLKTLVGAWLSDNKEDNEKEIEGLIETLVATDAGTEYMHEGVECDNPNNYTREWFAWSNSLFSELVIKYIEMKK
jgi:exo-beta-1,3-glucanase (GH17 family)